MAITTCVRALSLAERPSTADRAMPMSHVLVQLAAREGKCPSAEFGETRLLHLMDAAASGRPRSAEKRPSPSNPMEIGR